VLPALRLPSDPKHSVACLHGCGRSCAQDFVGYAHSMRRVAPWLPLAIVLGALTFTTYRAVGLKQIPHESVAGALLWALPYVCVSLYALPYVLPILLLWATRRVRLRTAAPPVVGWVALASAMPALIIAVWWPLDVARVFARNPRAPLIVAMTVDNWMTVTIWFVSIGATATWLFAVACRWFWFPRPVAQPIGSPPYR